MIKNGQNTCFPYKTKHKLTLHTHFFQKVLAQDIYYSILWHSFVYVYMEREYFVSH